MTCHWLMQNGLLPEDVVFVEVGSSAGVVDALRTGAIDALCNPDPAMFGLEHRNEIRLLGEARTLMASRKLMGGPVPGSCLWARTDFLQRQPELTQALTDAVVHALKWLQTAGLTDILKTVPATHWEGDRAIYLGAFEKLRESYALDGVFAANDVANAWRAYNRLPNRLGGGQPVLSSTYSNSFAVKSKNRFSA
jgi:NitT/TauT family transport system substrate-binding protein